MNLSRRALLERLSIAGAGCLLGVQRPVRGLAAGASVSTPERDWQWLVGDWDVLHERLRGRLEGSTTWDEFAGKSSCWLTLGGLGTIDDNLLYLPSGTYRAVGIRAFDPGARTWAIWWLDGRMAGKLDPPVRGVFAGDEGEFSGPDVHKEKPVVVRFRWHEISGRRPHWDQAYSPDGGRNWEINWRNYFTRTNARPSPVALDAREPAPPQARDWAALVGSWRVTHRRRTRSGWEEFDGTASVWPVMGGLGLVEDLACHAPSGTYHVKMVRAFDREAGKWRRWWVDGRAPREIGAPLEGAVTGDASTLIGRMDIDKRERAVRERWTGLASAQPRWERSISDNGTAWETDWIVEFKRAPRA